MNLKNIVRMYIIKNIRQDIYQFAPITISCKSYSKLLDVVIRLTANGLKLDVSYIEDNSIREQKKYHFLIKRVNDSVEDGYSFLKMFDILTSDCNERYYVFFKEECSDEENRDVRLTQLGF